MDTECPVKKHPTMDDHTVYQFETSGYDVEISFIDLINKVADKISSSTLPNAELRRVRAYGIRRFKDIDKMEY